eukprot:g3417.t1
MDREDFRACAEEYLIILESGVQDSQESFRQPALLFAPITLGKTLYFAWREYQAVGTHKNAKAEVGDSERKVKGKYDVFEAHFRYMSRSKTLRKVFRKAWDTLHHKGIVDDDGIRQSQYIGASNRIACVFPPSSQPNPKEYLSMEGSWEHENHNGVISKEAFYLFLLQILLICIPPIDDQQVYYASAKQLLQEILFLILHSTKLATKQSIEMRQRSMERASPNRQRVKSLVSKAESLQKDVLKTLNAQNNNNNAFSSEGLSPSPKKGFHAPSLPPSSTPAYTPSPTSRQSQTSRKSYGSRKRFNSLTKILSQSAPRRLSAHTPSDEREYFSNPNKTELNLLSPTRPNNSRDSSSMPITSSPRSMAHAKVDVKNHHNNKNNHSNDNSHMMMTRNQEIVQYNEDVVVEYEPYQPTLPNFPSPRNLYEHHLFATQDGVQGAFFPNRNHGATLMEQQRNKKIAKYRHDLTRQLRKVIALNPFESLAEERLQRQHRRERENFAKHASSKSPGKQSQFVSGGGFAFQKKGAIHPESTSAYGELFRNTLFTREKKKPTDRQSF